MKRLEVFQKMIEGTQALLQKQMEKHRSIEDQIKTWVQDRQVPNGPGNLVLPNGATNAKNNLTNLRLRKQPNSHPILNLRTK